jgi:hypothetical protein
MRRHTRLALAVGLLLGSGLPARPGEGNANQEKVVALVKKLGGKVEVNDTAPGERPEVPEGLAAVIDKMMAKDPNHRYQTPGEVADALEPFTR